MNGSRSVLTLIFIGLLSLMLSPSVGAASQSIYSVYVDDWYGFYKVSDVNHTPFKYVNQTLNINVGDTVIWVNDASDNSELTIVSEQNLWPNQSGYLKYNYRSFNYTFTKPGSFEIYMKEYPRRPRQTIVVAGQEPTPTATTPIPTPTATETPVITTTVAPTPQMNSPMFNLLGIMLAFIVVAGIVLLWYSLRKK